MKWLAGLVLPAPATGPAFAAEQPVVVELGKGQSLCRAPGENDALAGIRRSRG